MKYYKRIGAQNKILQIWLGVGNDKLIPYTCECEYFGEGINDLVEIDIEEFRDLGWLFECFSAPLQFCHSSEGEHQGLSQT